MEEQIQRLQTILGSQNIWENPQESECLSSPQVDQATNVDVDSVQYEGKDFSSIEYSNTGWAENTTSCNPVHDFPRYNLRFGQEAPEEELFCALWALTQYPYNHISKESRDKIVKEFFARGKIYHRPWDLFYIYPPASLSNKALILVPSAQVQHLLAAINDKHKTCLEITASAIESGLAVSFPKDGTRRPQYLGHTENKAMAEELNRAVPTASYWPGYDHDVQPTAEAIEAHERTMEPLVRGREEKKAREKEKKREKRHAMQQEWGDLTKRVQRYLGIRDSNSSTETAVKELAASDKFDGMVRPQFSQEDSVVFICVDCEAYEKPPHNITEIGIATLDTADISDMPPGEKGYNWMHAIRARHFRVKEYKHLVNSEHVTGNPENFLFGQSEWVLKEDTAERVAECFAPPFSAKAMSSFEGDNLISFDPIPANVKPIERFDPAEDLISFDDPKPAPKPTPKRKIVLVGHDLSSDIKYLLRTGYNPTTLENLHELVDTALMYRSYTHNLCNSSLAVILLDMKLAGWGLHNAGNDATLTLASMIAIAIRALQEEQDEEIARKAEEARVIRNMNNARDDMMDALGGWSSAGDGGKRVVPMKQELTREEIAKALAKTLAPTTDENEDNGNGGNGAPQTDTSDPSFWNW